MQSAAEINTVLSAGSVNGMVNSMASYGVAIDEEELMRELDGIMEDDDTMTAEAIVIRSSTDEENRSSSHNPASVASAVVPATLHTTTPKPKQKTKSPMLTHRMQNGTDHEEQYNSRREPAMAAPLF